MSKNKEYKCGYTHCLCPFETLTPDKAVKCGGKYYHPKCLETKDKIVLIRDYYKQFIDRTVVMKQLNSIINTIVFTKGVTADFLYFAIQYAYTHNKSANSPSVLHYWVDDGTIKKAYLNQYNKSFLTNYEVNERFDYDKQHESPLINNKRIGFNDILEE